MSDNKTEQNPGDEAPSGVAGFGALSEQDFIEFGDDKKEQSTPVDETKKDEEEQKADEPEKVDPKKEEKKVEAAAADKKEDTDPAPEDDGFKTPDGSKIEGDDEAEANWQGIAKDFGFEIKEDTYEAFMQGKEAFIEGLKTESVKDIKVKALREEIAELPAESQLLILGLKSGLTREQIEAPFKLVQEYKALSDADLVAKDLQLKEFTDDVVANEIEKLTESGKLEIEAKKLRI